MRRWITTFGVAVALTVSAVGCPDDDEGASTTDAGTGDTSTTDAGGTDATDSVDGTDGTDATDSDGTDATDSDGTDGTDTTDGTDGTDTTDGTDGTDTTDGTDGTDTTDGTDGTDTTDGTDGTDSTDGSSAAVPSNSAELLPWLEAGNYDGWDAESAVHSSAGPHGTVLTYVNGALFDSLTAGNDTHPVGAAAVKEIYDGDTVNGWAVMVKVSEGDGGDSWYWYEKIGENVAADGTNVGTCTGCHSPGSTDYFKSPFPLQ